MSERFKSNNLQDTLDIGQSLAQACQGGEVFAVDGPLGVGKTVLAQALAAGLGVKAKVNSPTFNIVKTYKIKGNERIKEFVHVDAYRLNSAEELKALGIEEIFDSQESVIFIEWADKVKELLPLNYISISLSMVKDGIREIDIKIK